MKEQCCTSLSSFVFCFVLHSLVLSCLVSSGCVTLRVLHLASCSFLLSPFLHRSIALRVHLFKDNPTLHLSTSTSQRLVPTALRLSSSISLDCRKQYTTIPAIQSSTTNIPSTLATAWYPMEEEIAHLRNVNCKLQAFIFRGG